MPDPEFSERDWYDGMAVAGFDLALQALALMISDSFVSKERVIEIIDHALLDAEERSAPAGPHARMLAAARFHLDRAVASLRSVSARS